MKLKKGSLADYSHVTLSHVTPTCHIVTHKAVTPTQTFDRYRRDKDKLRRFHKLGVSVVGVEVAAGYFDTLPSENTIINYRFFFFKMN